MGWNRCREKGQDKQAMQAVPQRRQHANAECSREQPCTREQSSCTREQSSAATHCSRAKSNILKDRTGHCCALLQHNVALSIILLEMGERASHGHRTLFYVVRVAEAIGSRITRVRAISRSSPWVTAALRPPRRHLRAPTAHAHAQYSVARAANQRRLSLCFLLSRR